MTIILLAAVLVAAVEGSPETEPLAPATAPSAVAEKRIREIPLDQKGQKEVHRVRVAIGYPAQVDFPEPFASPPACGDCGPTGLFRIEVGTDSFTIKPRLYPGVQPDGSEIKPSEFVTPIYVRLDSKIALTVQVELAERAQADTRVVFTLPNRAAETAYVQRQVSRAKAVLEESFAARLKGELTRETLRLLAEPHECVSSRARARHEDIVVEVRELCRLGGRGYVRFTIENRDDAPFVVGQLELRGLNDGTLQVFESPPTYLSKRSLEPRSVTTGVMSFPLEAGFKRLQLRVGEKDGKSRVIDVHEIGF